MIDFLVPFFGLCLAIGMVVLAFSGPDGGKAAKRRIVGLRDRHLGGEGNVVEAQMRKITAAKDTRLDTMAASLLPRPAVLKKRLDMTGRDWTVGGYGVASAGGLAVTALLLSATGAPLPLALLVGVFAGIAIPHMAVSFMINRRVNAFTARFPEGIELLVRGLRAGLPISETLGVVATEIPGPVGEEFRQVSDKIKIGRTMDAALQETADRLVSPEFQFFTIALAIQRETGGNLAETLSNLADVLRKRHQMKLKVRAMSSESKASAYIIGSLPFVVFAMIWFINGNYMQTFLIDERLMVAGLGGLVWMSIGAFIMSRMIAFEI